MMLRTAEHTPPIDENTRTQTIELLTILRNSGKRRQLLLIAVAITAIIILNALAQIRLNEWQGSIYDSIALRNLQVFYWEIGVFALIVSILLTLGVAQTWLQEILKVTLRQAVTFDLLDEWLQPRRAYRIPLSGEIGVNPDQRIQDDARRLTELSVDVGVGLLQATVLLASFIGVLWSLSAGVVFVVHGVSFSIPGYMVWAAIAYASAGSYFTWRVGRPLIGANTELRAREADFRFLLMRVNEFAEAIAVQRGEADERKELDNTAGRVLSLMRQIAGQLARLTWVTAGYGWLAIIAPILLAAPGYFSGSLTLGGLMMVTGAFYQVQQSLRWYVDRFPILAEWRATLHRVLSYHSALTKADTLGRDHGLITYSDHPEGKISIDELSVLAPNGRIGVTKRHLQIEPGERVLIAGVPKQGKSTFFRALAQLWPWGAGEIRLPPPGTVMFVPQQAYIPSGTLRRAIIYPSLPVQFSDEEIKGALRHFNLERLEPLLDVNGQWDKELTLDEQQRLAFVRALLLKPNWIIEDEAMSELDDDSQKIVQSMFSKELKNTGLISIGRKSEGGEFYRRIIELVVAPAGLTLPLDFCVDAERRSDGNDLSLASEGLAASGQLRK